jgi:hypothetical protein
VKVSETGAARAPFPDDQLIDVLASQAGHSCSSSEVALRTVEHEFAECGHPSRARWPAQGPRTERPKQVDEVFYTMLAVIVTPREEVRLQR